MIGEYRDTGWAGDACLPMIMHTKRKQEARTEQIQTLIMEISEMIKRHDKTIESHDTRLTALERQPGDAWGKVKSGILSALVTGLVAYFLSAYLNAPK